MKKMKDVRGTSAASVRNAISKEFKLEIPASNKQKNLYHITEWKKSMNVKECYNKLYADDDNVIEDITRYAFLTLLILMNCLMVFIFIPQLYAI